MIAIAEATPNDRTALMVLLSEMGRFYAERTDVEHLARAAEALTTPGGRAGPFCLLARLRDLPAGFVSMSGFFPAFDFSWGLLLKDIYVAEAHRGAGVGRALMTEAMRFATAGHYTRVDWTTDGTNGRAQAFYEGLGIAPSGKVYYRLTGSALNAAACGDWPPEGDAP